MGSLIVRHDALKFPTSAVTLASICHEPIEELFLESYG